MTQQVQQQVIIQQAPNPGQTGVDLDGFNGPDRQVFLLKMLFIFSLMITAGICTLIVFWGNILALFTASTIWTIVSMGFVVISIYNYANGDSSKDFG